MLSQLIEIKTPQEIEIMKKGAEINLGIIKKALGSIRVGMSTKALDDIIATCLKEADCGSAFWDYKLDPNKPGFQGNACTCINNEVFHAPPSATRFIQNGDLVTIDMGLVYRNLYADCAETVCIGKATPQKQRLIEACKAAFQAALPLGIPGGNIKNLSLAIDQVIRNYGFHPVEGYGGHGIGTQLHMVPFISNSNKNLIDCELVPGMVLAIEPACSLMPEKCVITSDGWTVAMSPNNLSSHYERMVVVTEGGGVQL